MEMNRVVVLLLLLACWLAPVQAARAQQDGLYASYMKAGKEFVDAGKYALALEEFRKAQRQMPASKGAVFNMSYCLLRLQRWELAYDRFQAYIAMNPGAAKVKKARLFVDQIKSELSKDKALLTLETDPSGATVLVDGAKADVPGTPVTFWLKAGKPTITLEKDGYEAVNATIELSPGAEKTRAFTLSRKVVENTPPVTPPGKEVKKNTATNPWPWVLAGAGGALALAGGGIYLFGALPQFEDANNKYELGDRTGGDDLWDGAVGKVYVTYALVGVGSAAIIGGVIWGLTQTDDPSSATASSLQITPLPGGASASWGFTF